MQKIAVTSPTTTRYEYQIALNSIDQKYHVFVRLILPTKEHLSNNNFDTREVTQYQYDSLQFHDYTPNKHQLRIVPY